MNAIRPKPKDVSYVTERAQQSKPNKLVSGSGKSVEGAASNDLTHWKRLNSVINNSAINSNPVHEHDRFFMAMLKPLRRATQIPAWLP